MNPGQTLEELANLANQVRFRPPNPGETVEQYGLALASDPIVLALSALGVDRSTGPAIRQTLKTKMPLEQPFAKTVSTP